MLKSVSESLNLWLDYIESIVWNPRNFYQHYKLSINDSIGILIINSTVSSMAFIFPMILYFGIYHEDIIYEKISKDGLNVFAGFATVGFVFLSFNIVSLVISGIAAHVAIRRMSNSIKLSECVSRMFCLTWAEWIWSFAFSLFAIRWIQLPLDSEVVVFAAAAFLIAAASRIYFFWLGRVAFQPLFSEKTGQTRSEIFYAALIVHMVLSSAFLAIMGIVVVLIYD
ncbi:MAG: hypothetical protein Q8Q62_19635 [Mesorhizobium sp.]|nr:hypothetical protein [Mesorhizobium sp.]